VFDDLRPDIRKAIGYIRKKMVPARRFCRFRSDVRVVRRGGQIQFAGIGRHEPAHPVSLNARHLRRHDDGLNVRDHRRYFFAGRTRPLSGRVFGGLGFRFCVWTNTGRLAHRPDFMASHVLRQLTCWNYRGHCSVPYFPFWHPKEVKRHIDWAGVVTLISCVVPLLLALTWVSDYGWSSARVELLLATAVIMLGGFLYAETKAIEPLIPLGLFQEPIISMCSAGVFVVGIAMFGMIIYLPLFMQGVLGVTATRSGNLLTPMMLGIVIGTFVCGQVTLRLRSYKTPIIVGSVLVTAGTILFARMNGSTRIDPTVISTDP